MNCERAAEMMPDYLDGALKPEDAKAIEAHLESCEDCRKEMALARDLMLLAADEASPNLRARFQHVLDAYEEGRAEGARLAPARAARGTWGAWDWLRSPIMAAACTAVVLALGFFGGRYMSNAGDAKSQAQLAAMQTQLANMQQLVVLSMLQEESAGERLQGVTLSKRDEQANPQILAALLHTLRYDNSVDVRLAALDALGRYSNHPQVREGLAVALDAQQSPLVQVQLIDMLVQARDRAVLGQLQKLEQDPSLDPTVRQRAHWAIGQLS